LEADEIEMGLVGRMKWINEEMGNGTGSNCEE
jgi:hypothetical protein